MSGQGVAVNSLVVGVLLIVPLPGMRIATRLVKVLVLLVVTVPGLMRLAGDALIIQLWYALRVIPVNEF